MAPSINPTWAAHFPSVEGVVTDIGGIFGHAAVVAREYKIPVVVARAHSYQNNQDGR